MATTEPHPQVVSLLWLNLSVIGIIGMLVIGTAETTNATYFLGTIALLISVVALYNAGKVEDYF